MSSKNRLKELLLKLSYEKKEVVLSSGKKSSFYFDGRQTALHPEGAFLIAELFLERILGLNVPVDAVGGPTLGADPLVTAVSLLSFLKKCPLYAFIIRKEPKPHGHQLWIEGLNNLKKGMNAVILEDVVTTGESSLKAAKRAVDHGLNVVSLMSVVDREEGGGESIRKGGYSFQSLFTKTELIG